ncbi:DEAD/DEAH box helicase domain-containing protein [Besnoitia besnoiti]|uniref:ATP-dependent RNA helicase n=1 Tax=Besnoitia besnoiti TaxID=94643 RepID=A0A2A9MPY2_BESBE|nr:DEAD/DEAH box helicase domain-containing protein [Besnoitia besnoiti]PFH37942.1 DEAD/DEAH box helicase domain-containing protein [Besnoitia besnoiti]
MARSMSHAAASSHAEGRKRWQPQDVRVKKETEEDEEREAEAPEAAAPRRKTGGREKPRKNTAPKEAAASSAQKRKSASSVKQEADSDESDEETAACSTACAEAEADGSVKDGESGGGAREKSAKRRGDRDGPTAASDDEASSDNEVKKRKTAATDASATSSSDATSTVVQVVTKKGDGGILDSSQSFESFSALYLDRRLARVAVQHLHLQHPTHVQAEVIPLALQGKDILAQARTGSGKTLSYVLPLLQRLLERREEEKSSQPRPEGLEALIVVPSKDLCLQIYDVLVSLLKYCRELITVNHTATLSTATALLPFLPPSVLVGTPSGLVAYLRKLDSEASIKSLLQRNLQMLVVDEADLLLSFGFENEMRNLLAFLPVTAERHFQALLLSATLNEEVAQLRQMLLHKAVMVKIDDTLQQSSSQLSEFYLALPKPGDKWVVLYAFLKLDLVPRKCLIFTSGVSSAYALRIFLERFGIGCGVLSPTLSIESRQTLIQAFNKGLIEILITTDGAWDDEEEDADDEELDEEDEDDEDLDAEEEEEEDEDEDDGEEEEGEEGDDEDDEEGENAEVGSEEDEEEDEAGVEAAAEALRKDTAAAASGESQKKRKAKVSTDEEFGGHRGLDLQSVACVLSFDMPRSVRGYIHRIGRAGRGGAPGVSVCLVNQAAAREVLLLRKLVQTRREGSQDSGAALKPLSLRLQDVECFRYRVEDVYRGVTKRVVAALVAKELQQEVLRSRKMREFFRRNPRDEEVLRAACKQLKDRALAGRGHLQHLPSYLLAQTPPAQKTAVQLAVEAQNAHKGPRASQERSVLKRRTLVDPLKSFKAGSDKTRRRPGRGQRTCNAHRFVTRASQLAKEPNHAETAPEHLPALSGRKIWKIKHKKNLSKSQPKGNFLRKRGKKGR